MEINLLKPNDAVRPLIDSLKIAIFQCEPADDCKITFINSAGAEILGYDSPADVLGVPLKNHFADMNDFSQWLNRNKMSSVDSGFDVQCKKTDGKLHLVGITSSMVTDTNGDFLRIDGVIRDIHANKKEEIEKEIVSNINRMLVSNLDIRKVYHDICDELRRMIEWDRVSIVLLEDKGDGVVNFALTKDEYKDSGILTRKMAEDKHFKMGGSILEEVVKTGKPHIVKDTISSVGKTDAIYAASGIRSRLGFPLEFKGKIIGSINFGCKSPDYYGEDHISLLKKIAPSLAFGVENTEKLDEKLENEVIGNINKILVSNLNLNEVDKFIFDELSKLMEWDRVSVVLLENKSDVVINFAITRTKGALSKAMPVKSNYPLIGSILEKVLTTGQAVIIGDTSLGEADTDKIYAKDGLKSRMAYPLKYKDSIMGSINFGCAKVNYYEKKHTKLLEKLAPSIAFGIKNSMLYERASKAEKEYKELSETFDSPWG